MPEAETWNANWICLSSDPREDLGVFAFRRRLNLKSVPTSFPVRISADQRCKLYVNGELVGFGPQRGDELHWFYETYDLAQFLQKGENWVAALVWNFGRWAPMAQHTVRTAFVLEAQSAVLSEKGKDPITPEAPLPEPEDGRRRDPLDVSTPEGWEVRRLETWGFDMLHSHEMNFYIDIGPGEIMDFRGAPWGWRTGQETPLPLVATSGAIGGRGRGMEVPDAGAGAGIWRKPHVIHHAQDRGANGGGTPWMLIPRSIPPMRYDVRKEPPVFRRGFAGDFEQTADYEPPQDGEPVWNSVDEAEASVSAASHRSDLVIKEGQPILLDYGELLCSYPRFTVKGPPGATLTVTYAEALWNPDGTKGNRDEVAGKTMKGYQDRLIMDGERRTIEPLWWRTYRYLLLEVGSARNLHPPTPSPYSSQSSEQGEGAILLHALDAIETGYPLKAESSFEADDPWVKPIWDVSIRTAERCAGETYFDCPYYEQLQYVGDTRIQALIGYYLGRDRALTRNAVETLGWSLMENGLTQSRYPSRQCQVIPPFSLWWVMMVWDQMLYDDWDDSYDKLIQKNLLGRLWMRYETLLFDLGKQPSFWPFTDWVPNWRWGVAPGGVQSTANRLTLALAVMCKDMLDLNSDAHLKTRHSRWKKEDVDEWIAAYVGGSLEDRGSLKAVVEDPAWVASEHAEALYRVGQTMAGSDADPWPTEALAKANAAKCTYYFSYYKHLAMFGRPVEGGEGTETINRTDRTDRSDRSIKRDGAHPPYPSYPFDFLQELQPWKEMIENGLSTFAENPEPTRSDCHAWSAHPILGFFQIVAGVTSTAPGWKKARIMPHPGLLKRFDAKIVHPEGELRVKWEDGRFNIESPIPFEFRWMGKREELQAGKHKL